MTTNHLAGFSIIISPLVPTFSPKIKLSSTVQVNEGFRSEFDQWLLNTFGTAINVTIVCGNIVVSPEAYKAIFERS